MRGLTVAVVGPLVVATALAFVWLDVSSHSASDTLRPLVTVMAPVWAVAIALLAVARRRASR